MSRAHDSIGETLVNGLISRKYGRAIDNLTHVTIARRFAAVAGDSKMLLRDKTMLFAINCTCRCATPSLSVVTPRAMSFLFFQDSTRIFLLVCNKF